MPTEFEVDEKLTIAKNKPLGIEITEGKIKCKELYIETDHLAVGGDIGHISTENGIIRTGKGNINADFGHIVASKGHIHANEGNIYANQGFIQAKDILINSSQELKQDISTLSKEEAYNLINELEPVKFAFKNDSSKRENIGFIAEDVPDIVSDEDHKSVRYMEIISALTKIVKEQEERIQELENKIR
jgi:Chaperone of endosialidase